MSRYQLTPADCRKGAAIANGRKGGRNAQAKGTAHKLTSEERRRGGLVTAAKRRQERAVRFVQDHLSVLTAIARSDTEPAERKAQRAAALSRLELGKSSHYNIVGNGYTHNPQPAELGTELPAQAPRLCGICKRQLDNPGDPDSLDCGGDCQACVAAIEKDAGYPGNAMTIEEAEKLGASLAPKLLTDPVEVPQPPKPIDIDPFTLSALRRFRLGPLSPLALTRSMRAQLPVLVEAGWLVTMPDGMVRLTAKGEEALNMETEDV